MGRGRPPLGAELVNKLDGSSLAKERLQIILQTLSKELTIPQACERLQLSEARFHELRSEWLQTACIALEPKAVGRPPTPEPSPKDQHIQALNRQIVELKVDLRATQIREEMALLMPDVMVARQGKKEDRRKRLEQLQQEWEERDLEKKSPHPSPAAKNTIAKNSGKSGMSST